MKKRICRGCFLAFSALTLTSCTTNNDVKVTSNQNDKGKEVENANIEFYNYDTGSNDNVEISINDTYEDLYNKLLNPVSIIIQGAKKIDENSFKPSVGSYSFKETRKNTNILLEEKNNRCFR